MNTKILLCLALVSGGGLLDCEATDRGSTGDMEGSFKLITLASFDGTNGAYPNGRLLLGRDGNFYGVTHAGGQSIGQGRSGLGYGTVFRATARGIITTLASFNLTNGINPLGPLAEDSNGCFYGVADDDMTLSRGLAFCLSPKGGLAVLHSFDGTENWENGGHRTSWQSCGAYRGGLTRNNDGNFYGTTGYGGSDYGTIYRMSSGGQVNYIFTFDRTNGYGPNTGLAQDKDGNMYGTTKSGGTNGPEGGGFGTVFKINPNGKLIWYACFDGINGLHPCAGLVQGKDGCFYGTTSGGFYSTDRGSNGWPLQSESRKYSFGTIFRVTAKGLLTSIATFANTNGACPISDLVQAADGNFYGATRFSYGYDNLGYSDEVQGSCAIFKLAPDGKLGRVVEIDAWKQNIGLASGLTTRRDGCLYGMTENGGKYHLGSLIKIVPGKSTNP